MSYRDKFRESQDKAHYQAIATKILSHMSDLRSLANDSKDTPRRWVWELIQNAKDVRLNERVKIKIELQSKPSDRLIFMHNGKPFTADNIRFLIEQISTKDRGKDETGKRKTTGKFGTGFLTTHLLAEKVRLKSVAKEPDLEYRIFDLDLDRSGNDLNEITESVKKSKESVECLDEFEPYKLYKQGAFNTVFTYQLTDETGKSVARKGLEDLQNSLPFALTFVEEIESIETIHDNLIYSQKEGKTILSDGIYINTIVIKNKTEQYTSIEYKLITLSKDFTTIAIPITINEKNQITIEPIPDEIPKLFCDFPLIGTEAFSFPVIINNPHFNPTDPRDGIFLTDSERNSIFIDENKNYLNDAIELYFQLLEYSAKENWHNLYLLAQIHNLQEFPKWLSESWYKKNVLNPIRTRLLHEKIVNVANGDPPQSILSADNKKYIWFPNSPKKDIRFQIWELANQWFPHALPNKDDVEIWYKLSWEECGKLTVYQLAKFVEGLKTLNNLKKSISEKNVYEWLKDFYNLIKLDEKNYDTIINNLLIFPNQKGEFCKKGVLWKDSGDIEKDLKDILELLGEDIRQELFDPEIQFTIEANRIRNLNYVVKEISNGVLQHHSQDINSNIREAFNKLLVWFKNNPESSNNLFGDLYRRKHLLYDDEVISENIEKAEQLNDLFKEYGVKDINHLRILIDHSNNESGRLLPVTQEIITSMGITSIEEWKDALQDKNLAAIFSHESTPSTDMFLYAQSLIDQAKKNILDRLTDLDEYDISEVDLETAPTIIAGIRKNEVEISVVARPAYNGEVIIYYGSEKDILDYGDAELWVDTGDECKRITLGHLLKKAEIRKFPI
ncbi:MAG: sacsin N-terminal ATP-binding-like domain-containing protein [Candidatus Cyclobacteriaceae bacterium M2_1C_046]